MAARGLRVLVRFLPTIALCGLGAARITHELHFGQRAISNRAIVVNSFQYRSGEAISEVTHKVAGHPVLATIRGWESLRPGSAIAILYDPTDPTVAVTNGSGRFFPGVLAIVIGAVIGVWEAVVVVSDLYRRRRLRHSELAW